jgi:hypothetical protein
MVNKKNTLILSILLSYISLAIFPICPIFTLVTENNQAFANSSNNTTSKESLNSFYYLIIFISLISCVLIAKKGRKTYALASSFFIILSIVLWIQSDSLGAILFWIIGIAILILSRKRKSPAWKRQKGIRRPFPKEVRDTILEKQKNKCANCNTKIYPPLLHFDHINGNRSDNRISNCQALCPNCHVLKTDEDRRSR